MLSRGTTSRGTRKKTADVSREGDKPPIPQASGSMPILRWIKPEFGADVVPQGNVADLIATGKVPGVPPGLSVFGTKIASDASPDKGSSSHDITKLIKSIRDSDIDNLETRLAARANELSTRPEYRDRLQPGNARESAFQSIRKGLKGKTPDERIETIQSYLEGSDDNIRKIFNKILEYKQRERSEKRKRRRIPEYTSSEDETRSDTKRMRVTTSDKGKGKERVIPPTRHLEQPPGDVEQWPSEYHRTLVQAIIHSDFANEVYMSAHTSEVIDRLKKQVLPRPKLSKKTGMDPNPEEFVRDWGNAWKEAQIPGNEELRIRMRAILKQANHALAIAKKRILAF